MVEWYPKNAKGLAGGGYRQSQRKSIDEYIGKNIKNNPTYVRLDPKKDIIVRRDNQKPNPENTKEVGRIISKKELEEKKEKAKKEKARK